MQILGKKRQFFSFNILYLKNDKYFFPSSCQEIILENAKEALFSQ